MINVKQTISPAMVFEALGKGIKIDFSEVGCNEWTEISSSAQISISDIYSGFLEFRFTPGMDNFFDRDKKNRESNYLAAFAGLDGDRNERYRVGKRSTFYYVLKRTDNDSFPQQLKGFDLYLEQNGSLKLVDKSKIQDWIIAAISKARTAKNNAEYNQILEDAGHFSTPEYKNWKRNHPRRSA
ncbi:hypothetical protein CDG60_09830 [Acinetobacter chinensis]|uniref:Uncharacterized protein n=1 Tax=Acinetobacter chinensis TaxID=2004650 RepID=A0A3B7LVM8_9GAMM|nr:hypothetical protein [Acinetobacter chinensis]AXY56836.1 hypothetical protein CDG60_09830 [Acinetobacter chinensis]